MNEIYGYSLYMIDDCRYDMNDLVGSYLCDLYDMNDLIGYSLYDSYLYV